MERTPRQGRARPYHLYVHTSAILKLYIDEPGTDLVRRAVEEAYSVRTSELAYVEARSAFVRLYREYAIDLRARRTLIAWLNEDWQRGSFNSIVPDAEVCQRAGALVGKHPRDTLGASAAVHLATALHLRENYRPDAAGDIVHFLTFDESLRRVVAREERLRLYEPPPPDAPDAGDPAEPT